MLMLDGHFDYGNGFHGRVYLNPHQLFRHPSTIWRLAQDLLDVLPARAARADRGRRRSGDRRRAARAHDGRPARRPPRADAPALQLRAVHARGDGKFALRSFYASRCAASACCSPTTCGTPGRRSSAAPSWCARPAAPCWHGRDLRPPAKRSSTLGVPNYALAEYQAPENYPAAECPMCKAGEPITAF